MGVDNPTMCREAILTRKDKSARWEAPGGRQENFGANFYLNLLHARAPHRVLIPASGLSPRVSRPPTLPPPNGSPRAPIFAAPLDSEVQRISSKGAAGPRPSGVMPSISRREEIASYNEGKLFIPASNRKLVTAALVTRAFKPTDRIRPN